MPLPHCIKRLLPEDLPLEEVGRFSARWSIGGVTVTPILYTQDKSIAICDTEQQIAPSLRESGGDAWYSIERLEEALALARRLRIDRVCFFPTEVNGKPSAPLTLIGKDSQVAITIAPHITWDSSDEDEDDEEDA